MLRLLPKNLVEVDLSDNAFGPDGIKAFECILKTGSSLKIFKVTNCGHSPAGGQLMAAAMNENPELKLTTFHAGRSRLETDGIIALSSCFEKMGTLEEISVP